MTAFAVTRSYSWTFNSTSGYLSTESGYKNDSEQQYVLTISTSSNVSSSNIFGTRIRKASDDSTVSPYVIHTTKFTGEYFNYSSTVDTSTLYKMRGKKDDTSSSATALYATGRVTY